MLEIIALIFLTKKIGETASRKGLPPSRWKWYTVLAWVGFEIAGIVLGGLFFGTGNMFGIILFAMACAVGGYLVVKAQLDKMPDSLDNDIDQIGR